MTLLPERPGPEPTGAGRPAMEPVAILVHVFYQDIWGEMANHIARNVRIPFRLVITTPLPSADIAWPDTDFMVSGRVLKVENRGRDILPFLVALEEEGETFEVGLKLHTKRSPHRKDGDAWRHAILESLAGSPERVEEFVGAFASHDHLGLVAPTGLLLPLRDRINDNRRVIARVARTAGLPWGRDERATGHFPAGSMFWFRRAALSPLAASRITGLFAVEKQQLDATAAHAVERLFAISVESRGYVALPADAVTATGSIRSPADARQLSLGRPVSPHAWQPPGFVMVFLRMPVVGWLLRRSPRRFRHLARRILTGRR